jgi:hypothetical protein
MERQASCVRGWSVRHESEALLMCTQFDATDLIHRSSWKRGVLRPAPLGGRYVRTASYNSSKNRSREVSSTTSTLGSYSPMIVSSW